MKKCEIYIMVALFMGATLLNSCDEDLLNVAPTTQLSTTIFWKTSADADLALTALYNYLAVGGVSNIGIFEPPFWDDFSDNSVAQNNELGALTALSSGMDPQSGKAFNALYRDCYQAIAADNSFLANVGKVLTGDQLEEYEGEAHFLRAFNYWWLARTYGNVPIVTANPFSIDPGKHLATSPRDSVLALVVSDLNFAIANLPDETYIASGGHITKDAAEGYLVRVLLFEKKYQQAAAMAKQIMEDGKFSLNPCYACNFYKPDQNTSPEIMFSVKFDPPTFKHPSGYAMMLVINGFKGPQGTQDLIDSYEMQKTGLPITNTQSGYNPADPYSGRDPRMRMTFFFPGDTKVQGWIFPYTATPGKNNWDKGYYEVKKWVTPGVAYSSYSTVDGNDWVLLRYADILLMYAEAQNEAVGPDASVYNAVNQVRERVGMPDLPSGLSPDAIRQDIRNERRWEFAMEGQRYFELRRWGIAEQTLNGFVPNPLYPNVKYVYKPNYNYWPVPQYEIDFNSPEMKQNPGY